MPTARHRSEHGSEHGSAPGRGGKRARTSKGSQHRRSSTVAGVRRSRALAVAIPLLAIGVATSSALVSFSTRPPQSAAAERTARHSAVPTPVPTPTPTYEAPVQATAVETPGIGSVSASRALSARIEVDQADIPERAYLAYRRAAQVINAADPTCAMPWEILAGIGYVETDHGLRRGATQAKAGATSPAIYSAPLNGRNGRPKVTDTDAGKLDRDRAWDRSLGPMMILPSTWTSVGVDANNDGKRNPQSIDDASLAVAIFLCSQGGRTTRLGALGPDGNLLTGTDPGDADPAPRYNVPALTNALSAYNVTPGYAACVIAAAKGYLASLPAPSTTIATRQIVSDDESAHGAAAEPEKKPEKKKPTKKPGKKPGKKAGKQPGKKPGKGAESGSEPRRGDRRGTSQ